MGLIILSARWSDNTNDLTSASYKYYLTPVLPLPTHKICLLATLRNSLVDSQHEE